LVLTYVGRAATARGVAAAAGLLAVSLPIGWILLRYGLRSDVQKYGLVFSAPQFLLGADRTQVISDGALMVRWFAVQLLAAVGLACGMRIAAPALPGRPGRAAVRAHGAAARPAAPLAPVPADPASPPAAPATDRRIRLLQRHVDFLRDLSAQMRITLSEAVQMVVDVVLDGEDGWHLRPAGAGAGGAEPVDVPIRFRADQMARIEALSRQSG